MNQKQSNEFNELNYSQQNNIKTCKFCQSDISLYAKICPYCRKKQKSAIPYIFSFIFISIFFYFIFGGNSSTSNPSYEVWNTNTELGEIANISDDTDTLLPSENNDEQSSKDNNSEEYIETKPTLKRYKIGDVVRISTENGDYEICFTSVKETNERNQFEESNPKKVVLISYKYKNIDYSKEHYDGSLSNEISINFMNLKVYDADGNILDIYPATLNYGESVTPGHKGTGEIAYGLNNDANYLEIEYYGDLFNSYNCVFDLEW